MQNIKNNVGFLKHWRNQPKIKLNFDITVFIYLDIISLTHALTDFEICLYNQIFQGKTYCEKYK